MAAGLEWYSGWGGSGSGCGGGSRICNSNRIPVGISYTEWGEWDIGKAIIYCSKMKIVWTMFGLAQGIVL